MPVILCVLEHGIHLIIDRTKLLQAHQQAPEIVPKRQDQFAEHLNKLAAFGIATRIEDDNLIVFYTPTYTIGTRLTRERQDAYYVSFIRPTTLRDHTKICRRAINLRAPAWQCHATLLDLNGIHSPKSGFSALQQAWKTEVAPQEPETYTQTLSPHAQTFLAAVDQIIDANEQSEGEECSRRKSLPYKRIEAIAATRSIGEVYRFCFTKPPPFVVKDAVRITDMHLGLKGRDVVGTVTAVEEQQVTVRFRRQLHFDRLPQPGVMQAWCSSTVYARQRAAVTSLRNSVEKKPDLLRNPNLLRNVVEAQFMPYAAPVGEADDQLNAAQKTALLRAEAVPDMLLVLGPPGTGKTHTIRKMVEVEAEQHRRVLVSSHSNTAVDNVLEGLVIDSDVRVVRVGSYERTSEIIKDYLIDEQARQLQAQGLKDSEQTYQRLDMLQSRWDDFERNLTALSALAARWRDALAQAQREHRALIRWQQAESRRRMPRLHQLARKVRAAHAAVDNYAHSAERWSRWIAYGHPLRRKPVVAALATVFVAGCFALYRRAERQYAPAARSFLQAQTAYQRACELYWTELTASAEALRLKEAYADAAGQATALEQKIRAAVGKIVNLVKHLAGAPPIPSPLTPASVEALVSQCRTLHGQIVERYKLLKDWHSLLLKRLPDLYPTLIRAADVVGSTCIGIAGDMRFDDLDFHLAIIDEAGQIAAPDLLVPLARAKRAVLVGDHKQLPPVVKEKNRFLEELEDAFTQELVTKSLFELIFVRAVDTHRVYLNKQYRLPALLANFVAEQCYEGKYDTERSTPYTDLIFAQPLVFIDTCDVTPVRRRRQLSVPNAEDGGRGYTNSFEAEIIAKLCYRYEQAEQEIGVIVPYRAQVAHIQQLLLERIPHYTPEIVREVVSTVDSFQGKERNIILFGFTRSNAEGRIGFLRDWRRLNVSITRARRQLILVGDSSTICAGKDDPATSDQTGQPTFTQMVTSLVRYAREYGQYIKADDDFIFTIKP